MKLFGIFIILCFGNAGVKSGEPIYTTENREPASIGDATIINQDFFRVEAFGESRAQEHKRAFPKKEKETQQSEENKEN